jgi:hypothetical protein
LVWDVESQITSVTVCLTSKDPPVNVYVDGGTLILETHQVRPRHPLSLFLSPSPSLHSFPLDKEVMEEVQNPSGDTHGNRSDD